jgi:signal transduction histidine kinase/CheY-like chemotaxis protein
MLLTGTVSLSAVGWVNYVVEGERLADIKSHIESAISAKAVTLVSSHALALRGLAADNAFSDVRELIANAVAQDADVTYGFFVATDDEKPWAFVSPAHPNVDEPLPESAKALIEAQGRPNDRASDRRFRMFGEDIHEYSAPVIAADGQRLGLVVYGINNERTKETVAVAAERSRRALISGFVTAGGVGLISLMIGIFWVRRSAARITKPLAGLTSAAHEIAAGNRHVRVAIHSGDEVELLASAFNQMLEANEEAMRKLEATTERALAADRMKSEFLANTSHEIRTPMNGVLGMLRLIRAMPLSSKLRRYVDTIDTSANALLTIINDILDFSKMEAGKYTLQSQPLEPSLVLQEVAELLASRAHDKGLDLIVRSAPALPETVVGDADRFRQVLNNLIGNAIKFTDHGEVSVHARLAQQDADSILLEVAVRDTGIGIEAEDLPKLYKAFSQVDGSMLRRHGGTGLGLAISQRLAHMMGGEIRVESRAGVGSTFTFTARFQLAPDATERRPRPAPQAYHRVLLIEPSARWREALEEQLEYWNMEFRSIESASEALDAVRATANGETPIEILVFSSAPGDPALRHALTELASMGRPKYILIAPFGSDTQLDELPYAPAAQLHKPLRFSELHAALNGTLGPSSDTSLRRADATDRANLQSPRPILVVDDNDVNRFVAVEELTQYGYVTEEAENGAEALEKVKSHDYLCVLMDCQMPVMDGYEATRMIRELERRESRARTPIIALTAHALVGERERVLDAGMDEFLSKPFRPSSLEKLLQRYARRSGMPPRRDDRDLDSSAKRSTKLTKLFLERMPEQLQKLRSAFEKHDAKELRACAHRIKGSALALAAQRMSESAEALQHLAEAEKLEEAGPILQQIETQYETVARLLELELASAKPSQHGAS